MPQYSEKQDYYSSTKNTVKCKWKIKISDVRSEYNRYTMIFYVLGNLTSLPSFQHREGNQYKRLVRVA